MTLFRDIPIQKKLMSVILLISGIMLLVTCSSFFVYEFYTFRQTTIQKLSTLGEIISTNSTAALAFQDPESAQEILAALKAEPHIVAACLYDKNGKLFTYYPSSLDLKKIPEAVADFFVICEASNQPQIRAISDSVEDQVKKVCGENPYRHEGRQNLQWVLIDYVNIVVHIMMPEQRKFYKLEEMWSDAPMEEHNK